MVLKGVPKLTLIFWKPSHKQTKTRDSMKFRIPLPANLSICTTEVGFLRVFVAVWGPKPSLMPSLPLMTLSLDIFAQPPTPTIVNLKPLNSASLQRASPRRSRAPVMACRMRSENGPTNLIGKALTTFVITHGPPAKPCTCRV